MKLCKSAHSYQNCSKKYVWMGLERVRSKKPFPKTIMEKIWDKLVSMMWNNAIRQNFCFYFSAGVCISQSLTLCLAPDPGPSPQFVFTSPGPQFKFIGPGPQFVFAGPGLQFVFTGLGPQFVSTSPGPNMCLPTLAETLHLPALVP